MQSIKPLALTALLVALFGCPPAEAPDPVEEPPVETPEVTDPQLTPEQLAEGAENIALVPSPIETQRALEAAGLETKLADLIPTDRTIDVANAELDNAAVRTGVVIADMMLTVKTAPNDTLLSRLGTINEGMKQLEGGADISVTIVDIQDRIKGGAVTRDELLKELDELSGAVIPELEFNGQDRVVPLIQAGSWLEGANLVARAVKDSGDSTKADSLLKQPAVVDYFISYVKTEGSDKAPPAVTQKMEASLLVLKGLAEKTEPLTMEDIDEVIATTNDVLALI